MAQQLWQPASCQSPDWADSSWAESGSSYLDSYLNQIVITTIKYAQYIDTTTYNHYIIMDYLDNLTCNQNTFSDLRDFSQGISIAIIVLSSALLLFFLFKMCRLCSYAFSYSNYHIHQTYKLYALSIINIMAALLVRKTQLDLYYFKKQTQDNTNNPATDANLVGFFIINDLFGIISILTNNILLLFNAFNWLAIAKNCDFTVNQESNSNIVQLEEPEGDNDGDDSFIKAVQNKNRRKIYYAKVYFLYCFLPMLLVLGIFGTLNHQKNDSWCIIINVSIIISSSIPLIVYGIAFALYLRKFSDPEVSKKTKAGLIFLFLSIITRSIFFLIFLIRKQEAESSGNVATLLYSIFCSLGPMLVMVLLSEVQLHKQQFNLLRRSSGLIFKSTII